MHLIPFDLHEAAILLDVDGTVLDLAPRPADVCVPEPLRRTLERLSDKTGGALALVSGRTLADLDRIFAPLLLPSIGGHGAEMRVNGHDGQLHPTVPLTDALRRRFAAIALDKSGLIVEDKGYSLALHYRLAPRHAPALREAVAAICAELPPDTVEVLPGKALIEVKQVGFNKGTAVRELMSHPPFHGRRPIFIGDDTTDEAAFAVVPEFDGIAFSVGRKVPGALSRFKAPRDVRGWLEHISEAGGNGGS